MSKQPLPTDSELAILACLWEIGPATVRQVHEHLADDTGYTTTLKLMQLMTEKGLLRRDTSARSHVYAPTRGADHTRQRLVRDLIGRAFGGSPAQLAMSALSAERPSPEELAEVRRYLDALESKK